MNKTSTLFKFFLLRFVTMLSVLLCCAVIFAVSTAAPGGAPATTCDGLTPLPGSPHVANGITEQPTPNPWMIDICDFDEIMGYYTYSPGNTYTSKLNNAECYREINPVPTGNKIN